MKIGVFKITDDDEPVGYMVMLDDECFFKIDGNDKLDGVRCGKLPVKNIMEKFGTELIFVDETEKFGTELIFVDEYETPIVAE